MNKTIYSKGKATTAPDMAGVASGAIAGVVILRVPSNPDSVACQEFESEVNRVMASKPRLVVIDLSEADSVSTVILGMILKLRCKATENGGEVRLAGVQPMVRRVLDICRLDRLFAVFSSPADAMVRDEVATV